MSLETVWMDVVRVLSTGIQWIALVASALVGFVLARSLTLARIRRGEEPVGAAKAMVVSSSFLALLVFVVIAYFADALTVGSVVVGSVVLVLLPTLFALAFGRPLSTAGA